MPRVSKDQNKKDADLLIDALLRHPGADADALAQTCKLSVQQVYRILRVLQDEGIITGQPYIVDLAKVGKKRFLIMAKRSGDLVDENTFSCALYTDEFINRIREENLDIIPEDDYTCSGEFDMITTVIANDAFTATKYVDLLRTVSHGYFSRFSIEEVMYTTRRNAMPGPDIEAFISYLRQVQHFQR